MRSNHTSSEVNKYLFWAFWNDPHLILLTSFLFVLYLTLQSKLWEGRLSCCEMCTWPPNPLIDHGLRYRKIQSMRGKNKNSNTKKCWNKSYFVLNLQFGFSDCTKLFICQFCNHLLIHCFSWCTRSIWKLFYFSMFRKK